jgi:hypothetical protein
MERRRERRKELRVRGAHDGARVRVLTWHRSTHDGARVRVLTWHRRAHDSARVRVLT